MTDQDHNHDEAEDAETYEVYELESEEGEVEEFVVIDTVEIKGAEYAVMAMLEDVQNMETMSEDEFREEYGDDPIFTVMRREGEVFHQLEEEEYEKIQGELEAYFDEQAEDEDEEPEA